MKRSHIILLVVSLLIIILFSLLLFSFSLKDSSLTLGVLLPLTGSRAEAGKFISTGLELALQEINTNPQKNYKISLVYEDTQYNSKMAVEAFQKLINFNKIHYLIGTQGSSEALAVAPLAQENKILFITPGAQSDEISKAGDYVFRTMTHTSQDAVILAKILSERTQGQSLFILAVDTDFTPSFMQAFEPVFTESGGKIGLLEKYNVKEKDFRSLLLKIKKQNPHHLLFLGSPQAVALQLKQAKEMGIKTQIYGLSALENQEFITQAGNLAEGLLLISPYDSDNSQQSIQEFRRKYQAAYHTDNELYSAIAYDTLHILSSCF